MGYAKRMRCHPRAGLEGRPWPDYAKIDYYTAHHHERFKRYVAEEGIRCPCCGGTGSFVADTIDIYWTIYHDCGLCEGTGRTPRHDWAMYMHDMKRWHAERRKLTEVTT